MHLMARTCEPDRFDRELEMVFEALSTFFQDQGLPVAGTVFIRLFISDYMNQQDCLEWIELHCRKNFDQCAFSILQQPPLTGNKLAVWLYAIHDEGVKQPVAERSVDRVVVKREALSHIWCTQLLAEETSGDSHAQTSAAFARLNQRLQECNCTIENNCIRTWLFVKDIDFNYHGVVCSRRELFETLGMTNETHYIASTGIEGRHADPKVSVMMDAYAIAGVEPSQIKYLHALTHLNPTHEYGVTFERGTSVDFGDRRHSYISGTASINNKGEILHQKNVSRQLDRVFENIAALLADAESGMEDIAQMIVYLRDLSDAPIIEWYFTEQYREVPKVIVLAPVCRPGWLVEIECIAIKAVDRPELCNF
jgi:enamine deaminase RidA (YjgF/YER057c/UK114 family)